MFTCLELTPKSRGLFSETYEKMRPPRPEREYVQVKGGTPFLRLKVKENHLSWAKISSALERNERRLLTGDEISVPPLVGLSRAEPAALGMTVMMKRACALLAAEGRPKKLSLSVYDRDGVAVSLLETSVSAVRYVSVYTEKIREYFYAASKIMEQSGMSVKINEYESVSPPGEIIVADRFRPCMKKARLIFLPSDKVIAYNTVTGEGFTLGEEYENLKSGQTDDFLFASALYEYCGVRSFAQRDFEHLCLAGRRVSDETLISKL